MHPNIVRMKRLLLDIDSVVPPSFIECVPGMKDTLSDINSLIKQIDSQLLKKKRVDLALISEPMIKQKIIRMFVRHAFFAQTATESSYFMIYIDGLILDSRYQENAKLGSIFDRISIQIDKKYNPIQQNFEWKEDDYPLGSQARGVQVKVYAEKSCMCKISLRRAEIVARYNISDQLRKLLPNLRVDPSEEEVTVALFQYIDGNNLFGDRDRRLVRCDDALKGLFPADTLSSAVPNNSSMSITSISSVPPLLLISTLRSKLISLHLVPAQPIIIEHYLNPANTEETFNRWYV